jgi:macrolide-specific efflux system membrane fusion protein
MVKLCARSARSVSAFLAHSGGNLPAVQNDYVNSGVMSLEACGQPPRVPHRRRTRLLGAVLGLAFLVSMVLVGRVLWQRSRPTPEAVVAVVAQRGDLEDLVTATGSLQPRDYVDVGAQVSGQLRKIHVVVGSEVNEGDLLAEIDAEQSAARVDANRAQIRAQQAQLVELDVALTKALRDLTSQRNLAAEDATTAEALQNADTTVRSTRAQIESLKAQMEQTRATMRVDEANLKYTKIFAPMAGTVVSISARQGQTLNTNQSAPTILRIADLSTMQVQTQVSEADVSRLRAGMPVYFTTLGGQGRRWNGTLQKIEPTPTVTNNVVLYNALFEVPNPNRSLMTQMTAQVFFVAAHVRDVLLVPMAAVTLAGRGPGAASPVGAALPASGPASGSGGAGLGARPRDRDAFNALPDAERERLRAERRAAREAAGSTPASMDAGLVRPGIVKVVAADGTLSERRVGVGVSNRVQAQIVEGLQEGERVVAGTRAPESNRSSASNSSNRNLGIDRKSVV